MNINCKEKVLIAKMKNKNLDEFNNKILISLGEKNAEKINIKIVLLLEKMGLEILYQNNYKFEKKVEKAKRKRKKNEQLEND